MVEEESYSDSQLERKKRLINCHVHFYLNYVLKMTETEAKKRDTYIHTYIHTCMQYIFKLCFENDIDRGI